jgi:hypothetical protein
MYRFSTLIKCKKCGMTFKAKKERGKVKYICSGYDRFGKAYCERAVLKEKQLNEMLEHKFDHHISDEEVKERIHIIYVDGKYFEIFYKDGSTQLVQPNFIKLL